LGQFFLMTVIDASWGSSVAVVGFFFAGTVLLAMVLAPWLGLRELNKVTKSSKNYLFYRYDSFLVRFGQVGYKAGVKNFREDTYTECWEKVWGWPLQKYSWGLIRSGDLAASVGRHK
jgi:hypothetical protein